MCLCAGLIFLLLISLLPQVLNSISIFKSGFIVKVKLYREKRWREIDFPFTSSLPKRSQWPELTGSGTRSFLQISHTGAGSKGPGPSITAFPGQKQKVGLKVEQLGHKTAPIWHAGVPGRSLTYYITVLALISFFFF